MTTCYLVLAHADPEHIRRLTAAVAPRPVVLHCDAATDDASYAAMTADPRVVPVPRRRTPWASAEAAFAELDGIRAALELDGWEQLVVMQGSEYLLRSAGGVDAELAGHRGRTLTAMRPLPRPEWRGGGLARLRYPHWVVRRHMLRVPVPRRLPRGIHPAGGSVNIVLAREHARLLVDLADRRPDLAQFWQRSWGADETFVQTLLYTALVDAGRTDELDWTSRWFTVWSTGRSKSPEWLTERHLDALLAAARRDPPALFARKIGTQHSGRLLDELERHLHRAEVPA
jgi:hypothetical protein